MDDINAQFEERAERFYQATHVMAPGKDEPALGNHTPYEHRIALWKLWCENELLEARLAQAERGYNELKEKQR